MKNRILQVLEEKDNFLIVGHVCPDGDALGSAVALSLCLSSMGKNVVTAVDGGLPGKYRFMSEYTKVYTPQTLPWSDFECAIAVDTASLARLGTLLPTFCAAPFTINIDHHATNERFGDLAWIEERSAAGELVLELIEELIPTVSAPMAGCLYAAISTDTGNFTYSNTTAACLGAVARLCAYGAEISRISDEVFRSRTLEETRLIGRALETLKLFCEGRLALIHVMQSDMDSCGAKAEHCEGIIDYAREVDSVELAAFFREMEPGKFKCSLRSKRFVDVSALAAEFGGGGHNRAAGCVLTGSLEQVKETILERAKQIL